MAMKRSGTEMTIKYHIFFNSKECFPNFSYIRALKENSINDSYGVHGTNRKEKLKKLYS